MNKRHFSNTDSSMKEKSEIFETIIRGMWRSVNDEGTGHAAKIEGFDVCGKTGSTQVVSTVLADKLELKKKKIIKTHSWFTGFAPRNNPQIVITMLVERAGLGGEIAAPMARELFMLYRNKYDR